MGMDDDQPLRRQDAKSGGSSSSQTSQKKTNGSTTPCLVDGYLVHSPLPTTPNTFILRVEKASKTRQLQRDFKTPDILLK